MQTWPCRPPPRRLPGSLCPLPRGFSVASRRERDPSDLTLRTPRRPEGPRFHPQDMALPRPGPLPEPLQSAPTPRAQSGAAPPPPPPPPRRRPRPVPAPPRPHPGPTGGEGRVARGGAREARASGARLDERPFRRGHRRREGLGRGLATKGRRPPEASESGRRREPGDVGAGRWKGHVPAGPVTASRALRGKRVGPDGAPRPNLWVETVELPAETTRAWTGGWPTGARAPGTSTGGSATGVRP